MTSIYEDPNTSGPQYAYPQTASPYYPDAPPSYPSAPDWSYPSAPPSYYPQTSLGYPLAQSFSTQPQFPMPRRNNARNIILGIIAVLVVAGVAIGVAISTSSHTSRTSTSTMDRVFVATIHRGIPQTANTADSMIVGEGHQVCSAFGNGDNFLSVAGTVMDDGYTPYESGYYIGASIAAYCPKYMSAIPDH